MKDVVPLFFSFSKYASFTRQITGWNFSRKGTGSDRGSYYHELFLRGRPHLVKFMKREVTGQMKIKSSGVNNSGRKDDSSLSEPDLFELSKACPLPDPTSSAIRSNVVSTAGAGESQQQFVSQAGANPHRHLSADNGAPMQPQSGHHYIHHHNGYQQWAASDATYSNYYPPPAHHYAQPIQVQGQQPSQYSEQERYSDHRLHEQHRSMLLHCHIHTITTSPVALTTSASSRGTKITMLPILLGRAIPIGNSTATIIIISSSIGTMITIRHGELHMKCMTGLEVIMNILLSSELL